MKRFFLQKHIDYLIILVLFVIPPVFASGEASSFSPAAPFLSLLLHCALCAYIICKNRFVSEVNEASEKRPLQINTKLVTVCAIVAILAFCMLMMNSFAWNVAAGVFGANQVNQTIHNDISKIMPVGAAETAYSVVSLLVAALYEELLYRRFLPDEAKSFLPASLKVRIVAEILIIAVFALGHRYLGVWAVLNAFTAGCILRFFCVRTGSVVPGFVAHFVYNLIMFFVF